MHSEETKRQAFSLHVRGKSKREIASLLKTTSKKVGEWIEEQKAINHGTLQRINKEDYVGIAMQRFAEIRDETWTNFQSCTKPGDRAKFLKLAMDVELKEAQLLTDMGFLKSEGKKTDLNVNIIAMLKDNVQLNRLDALTTAMLSKTTGMDTRTIMNMQGAQRNVQALPEAVGLEQTTLPARQPIEIEIEPEPADAADGVHEKGDQ